MRAKQNPDYFRYLAFVDLTRLEEKNRNLSKIEVDEMLGLMSDIRAKVTTDYAVPSRVVLLVKLFLDEGSDVLLDVVLLKSLGGAVDRVLLHVLGHVCILDHCLSISHK